KTSFARLNVPSSCASCCTVSTMTRLICSASAAGIVENADVSSTSAMWLLVPHGHVLVPRRGRRTERVEPGLEPAPSDPDADRLGEVQGCVRLLPGRDALTEPAERRQRLVSDPRIDEHLGALGVPAPRPHPPPTTTPPS